MRAMESGPSRPLCVAQQEANVGRASEAVRRGIGQSFAVSNSLEGVVLEAGQQGVKLALSVPGHRGLGRRPEIDSDGPGYYVTRKGGGRKLILHRRPGDVVHINHTIRLRILSVERGFACLALELPGNVCEAAAC